MKKTKTEKGITLIALILTIVILLILAIVAINSITNDGLLGKAENVTGAYNNSVINEQGTISGYGDFLGKYTGGDSSENIWTQDKTTVTNGKVTLEVGQTVTGYDGYSGSYTGGWAVLGAENGKLLLVSKVNVQSSVGLYGKDGDTANGYQAGYYNGIEYLNSLCASYLNSTLADEARSIKVEDINRVTGYNPESTGDGTIYKAGYPNQYGNTVTYTLKDGKVAYSSDKATGSNASAETSDHSSFKHVDGRVLGETDDSIDVKSNYYWYYPYTLTTSSSGTTKGIERTSDAYKVLFKQADGSTNDDYWVASHSQLAGAGYARVGLRKVSRGRVDAGVSWDSEDGALDDSKGVRAVVSLKSGVNVSETGVIS